MFILISDKAANVKLNAPRALTGDKQIEDCRMVAACRRKIACVPSGTACLGAIWHGFARCRS
jgi:hypothetical protein